MPRPERTLIRAIRRRAPILATRAGRVHVGIGDDCAVLALPKGHEALLTTDLTVEGMHFRRDWHPPRSVGHRCLARGLSDIASMGGRPLAAFLSLALPVDAPPRWLDGFLDGLLSLARAAKVTLAGGDTSASPRGIVCDIVAVGTVPAGRAVLRSTARPGDLLYITGCLGGAAAELQPFLDGARVPHPPRPGRPHPHFYPQPRVELGPALRERGLCTAMIDTSDGLSTDLGHLCDESHLAAEIDVASLPLSPLLDGDPHALDRALHGGEDYELLFTARPQARIPRQIGGVPITRIGAMLPRTASRRSQRAEMWLIEGGRRRPLHPGGWEHLRDGGRRTRSGRQTPAAP